MKKGGGSESTIIVGPSKSVLVYALHSLEYVLGLARFRVFVPNLLLLYTFQTKKTAVDYLFPVLSFSVHTFFEKVFFLVTDQEYNYIYMSIPISIIFQISPPF